MPYIGSQQGTAAPVLLDAISVVNGQAAYTLQKGGLNYQPASTLVMQVSLNGIIQQPGGGSYTIDGSTITFASNLVTGDVIDYILVREPTTGTIAPVDGSITDSKIVSMAASKLTGALPAIDGSALTGVGVAGISSSSTSGTAVSIDANNIVTMPSTPIFSGTHSAATNISNQVLTSSNFYDTIWVNQGNHFNTSTGRFTIPIAGVYRMFFRCTSSSTVNVRLRKNGNTINEAYGASSGTQTVSSEAVINCVVGDYLDIEGNALPSNGGSQHKQVTMHLLG